MVDNIRSVKVMKEDLVLILNKMVSEKIEDGYMDFVEKNGKYTLTFFITNPKFNGKDAIKVNQKELLNYLLL